MDNSNNSISVSLAEAYKNDETRQLLPIILPLLTQIVFTVDIENNVLQFYNENRLFSLLEYTPEDVKKWNNNMLNLICREDQDWVTVELLRVHALEVDASHSFNCRVNQKSGNYRHLKITGTVLSRDKQGKSISFLYTMEDNTQSVNPEKKIASLQFSLHDTKHPLQTDSDLLSYKEMIAEREYFLNQGSWETNLLTGETNWSKGMYYIFGYETDEQINNVKVTNVLHLSHMSEEEVTTSIHNWEQVLSEKENYVREATIISLDGRHKHVETYGKIIRNTEGIPEKVIGTTRDITSLQEYKKSLEEKINELKHTNTELEGFAYIASHDLQEPLRKLTAFSERLQTKFKEQLGEEGKMYLDRITASTENMRTLIDNLLEFSRTARPGEHFSKHDITNLLEEVKADLEMKIEESDTLIDASTLPVIEVIPSQIKQLFNNLLSNSIKFKTADYAPVITISCEKLSTSEKNTHNLRNNKEYYKLSVTDNGIGFEPEYAEKIFQIFQRLHGKHEYPGSGIGLAICKKIIENHHGIIYARSEIHSGSVFTVILPENQL